MNAVRKFVIFVILSSENTYERARTWTRTLTESAQAVAREKSEGKKVWERAEGRESGGKEVEGRRWREEGVEESGGKKVWERAEGRERREESGVSYYRLLRSRLSTIKKNGFR